MRIKQLSTHDNLNLDMVHKEDLLQINSEV